MKKILITGAAGQLGSALLHKLRDNSIFGTDSRCMDFTDRNAVKRIFSRIQPDIVIHSGAYTAVDKAETDRENCYRVNVTGTENIVNACLNYDAELLYVSTDYVFSGKKGEPYTEYDIPAPLSWYGLTKFYGEQAVMRHLSRYYIVRTSWVYGSGENFAEKIIKRATETKKLNVVNDQTGSPTLASDLALQIRKIVECGHYGIYHCSGIGACTWYEFASEILHQTGIEAEIKPVRTSDLNQAAVRPEYSYMSSATAEMVGISSMRHWKDALKDYIAGRNT